MDKTQTKQEKIEISICTGTNCEFRGASQLVEALRSEKGIQSYCTIREGSCSDNMCDHSRRSPVVKIDDDVFLEAKPEVILDEVYARIRNLREE